MADDDAMASGPSRSLRRQSRSRTAWALLAFVVVTVVAVLVVDQIFQRREHAVREEIPVRLTEVSAYCLGENGTGVYIEGPGLPPVLYGDFRTAYVAPTNDSSGSWGGAATLKLWQEPEHLNPFNVVVVGEITTLDGRSAEVWEFLPACGDWP